MGRWSLPAKIRSMIEMEAEDYRFKSEQYALAGYASVCWEWQPVFEQRNFQRLVLDQERISDLEQAMGTKQRRDYLGHLFLRVRLNDYDCAVCKSKEDYGTISNNNNIFSTTVWNLLVILSKWTGFMEPTEYSPGTIHIRGLQQTSPPGTSHQACKSFLGRALSKSSRFLENLSVAFLVDAKDFFANLWPTNEQNSNVISWEKLRRLALTSRLLHPEIGRGNINKLLIAAGRAAAFMPKLEVMEIWNGGEGHACLFRYSNDAGEPKITWACNWGSNV